MQGNSITLPYFNHIGDDLGVESDLEVLTMLYKTVSIGDSIGDSVAVLKTAGFIEGYKKAT
jgi:hypothetical protein